VDTVSKTYWHDYAKERRFSLTPNMGDKGSALLLTSGSNPRHGSSESTKSSG